MTANGSVPDRQYAVAVAAGAAAWALAYLASYVATTVLADPIVLRVLSGGSGPPTTLAGWAFFGAHFVDVSAGPFGSVNALTAAPGPAAVLFAAPPLALSAAGALTAALAGSPGAVAGARTGPGITFPYLGLSVTGALLFQYRAVAPDPATAAVVAGLVYPLVFGTIGGAVGGATLGRLLAR